MAYVNPTRQSLKMCFQSHYSLPYFQREYKWESKHFTELVNDIQSAFLANYDATHGRNQVAKYVPYFLGSIITSAEADGKKPLIDGQQRLTSTFMILAYLHRYKYEHAIPDNDAHDLAPLLYSVSYGIRDYSIEFSPTRKAIFDRYLDTKVSMADALKNAEDVDEMDDGDRKILGALRNMESLLDSQVRDAILYFMDYVIERVMLIEISVDSEAEAHRVFVTMNDRGLRLGPIDLLKGRILSRIKTETFIQACHSTWVTTVNKLRAIDPDEDSHFFRNLMRAKWAEAIRGKSKGDQPRDYDIIGDAYHRWFEDNTKGMGISNEDGYVRFVSSDMPKWAEIYCFIRQAETELQLGFECVYYNAARKYSFQAMVLLASTKVTDSTLEWQKKIALVSQFVDLILTARTVEGKENNYDNLKEISFYLALGIRDLDYSPLLAYIQGEWPKYNAAIPGLTDLKYTKSDRSEILYLLARIACHLEDAFALSSRVGFATYWQRDRNQKTYDIEHLLKEPYDPNILPASHGFKDQRDYAESRNLFGALVLLPRSRNRSLQDKSYREKLPAYATENVLTQTLCDALYESNPNVAAYVAANAGFGLAPIPDFTKSHIDARGALYVALAQQIWSCPS